MKKIQQEACLSAWVTIVLVSALTACSSDSEEKRPARTTKVAVSPAASVSPSPTGPLMYKLKDTAKWDDISVKLSSFDRGRTSKAGVPEDTNYVKFTVTATNDSKDPFSLDDLSTACTTQEVFDGTKDLSGAPEVHVMPNRSVSWYVACAQYKGEKYVQVEITPYWDDNRTAIFSGTIE